MNHFLQFINHINGHILLFTDAVCIALFTVHFTDIDLGLKIVASSTIIMVNAFAFYTKYIKKNKK